MRGTILHSAFFKSDYGLQSVLGPKAYNHINTIFIVYIWQHLSQKSSGSLVNSTEPLHHIYIHSVLVICLLTKRKHQCIEAFDAVEPELKQLKCVNLTKNEPMQCLFVKSRASPLTHDWTKSNNHIQPLSSHLCTCVCDAYLMEFLMGVLFFSLSICYSQNT